MKNLHAQGIALAMAMVLGLPLAAQAANGAVTPESPFSADLKLHFGWTPAERDHLHHDYQVIGVDFGYQTKFGRAGLELGWSYKTGDGFVEPVGADPTVPPAGVTNYTSPVPVSRNWSGDARRNDLNGLMARLSLTHPFTAEIDWQVGLQIGGTLWNQQYFGDISGGRPTTGSTTTMARTWAWRDLYNGNLKGHFVGFSPYAGIKFEIGHHGALEFNALLLNYKSSSLVHYSGLARAYDTTLTDAKGNSVSPTSAQNDFPLDTSVSRTHYAPHVEVAYVYHF